MLAACVQLALAGPHVVPPPEPAMAVDGGDRKQLEPVCHDTLS